MSTLNHHYKIKYIIAQANGYLDDANNIKTADYDNNYENHFSLLNVIFTGIYEKNNNKYVFGFVRTEKEKIFHKKHICVFNQDKLDSSLKTISNIIDSYFK